MFKEKTLREMCSSSSVALVSVIRETTSCSRLTSLSTKTGNGKTEQNLLQILESHKNQSVRMINRFLRCYVSDYFLVRTSKFLETQLVT